MKISHPDEILKRLEDSFNLLILRKGQVGFTVKKPNCSFNDKVIDTVQVRG